MFKALYGGPEEKKDRDKSDGREKTDILDLVQKRNGLLVCIFRVWRINGPLVYMHNKWKQISLKVEALHVNYNQLLFDFFPDLSVIFYIEIHSSDIVHANLHAIFYIFTCPLWVYKCVIVFL